MSNTAESHQSSDFVTIAISREAAKSLLADEHTAYPKYPGTEFDDCEICHAVEAALDETEQRLMEDKDLMASIEESRAHPELLRTRDRSVMEYNVCRNCGEGIFTRDGKYWYHEAFHGLRPCDRSPRRFLFFKKYFVATPSR